MYDGLIGGAARNLHHLIDAAARRVHFHVQFAIGGASVQTQSAMHAAVEIGLLRFIECAYRRR